MVPLSNVPHEQLRRASDVVLCGKRPSSLEKSGDQIRILSRKLSSKQKFCAYFWICDSGQLIHINPIFSLLFCSVFGLHHLLRTVSGSLFANFISMIMSQVAFKRVNRGFIFLLKTTEMNQNSDLCCRS